MAIHDLGRQLPIHRSTLSCLFVYRVQSRRELRRGYTTATAANVNATEIDWKSGAVVRRAGEPILSRAELNARLREVRSGTRRES